MAGTNDAIKRAVLAKVASATAWKASGQTSFTSELGVVHARYKTSGPYSFNINPATLRADSELWICGKADIYYLLPRSVVRRIYDDPGAYIDARHPKIRVVSEDTTHHRGTYAVGGQSIDLGRYYRGTL